MKPELDALAGTVLAGKYRLVSLLGSGGMGFVYQAEQLGLGRSVAVKVVRPDLPRASFEHFSEEAMAVSRINHPNAVAVYDFGFTRDEVPYLVMEHLRGQTLATLIDGERPAIPRAIALVAQVLSALAEAHACGVVHCDLTSDNVIVERLRVGDDFAKVIDFGLARLFNSGRAGAIAGTPECMAPEQIRGEELSPRTDLYAVGVLLYEMIVGRTPFAGSAVPVILEGHLHASPIPLAEVVPSCPRGLSELVARALAKSPDERPESALAMRDALLASLGADGTALRESYDHDRPARQPRLAAGTRPGASAKSARRRAKRTTRLSCELARDDAALVGRDAELASVVDFCGGARGRVLAIVGAPGAGKARLVVEATRRLADEHAVHIAAADPSGLRTPWYPVLGVLEEVLGLEGTPGLAELRRAVARCGLSQRDVPGLAEIFGIRGARELELAVRRREAHAAALRALLSVRHRAASSVYAFADADDYDEPSRRLVRALAGADAPTVRLIVTTARQDAVPAGAEVLPLTGLDAGDAAALAAALLGSDQGLTEAAVESITRGAPGAVEQLAGWLGTGQSIAAAPSLLVDLVSVRVNRLRAAPRRVLQAVATGGTVAPRWLLDAVLDDEALASLDEPLWTGLLVVEDDAVTIPSDLVASVVSACTPADVRRALHAAIFEALGGGAHAGVLGHHAEHGGHHETAYELFMAAATDAVDRFDDAGATAWYGRALGCARELMVAGLEGATHKLVRVALDLADLLRIRGRYGLAAGLLVEADGIASDDASRARGARIRGGIALGQGDGARAVSAFERAIGLALRDGDREQLVATYLDLAVALDRCGRGDDATRELAEGIDVITLGEGLGADGAPPRLWYLGLRLAERHLRARRPDDALAVAHEAHVAAAQTGSARGRGRVSALLAELYELTGDPGEARRHRNRAIEELRELGDRRTTAELLLDAARSRLDDSGTERPGSGDDARLAAEIAAEIGWRQGVERARRVTGRD